MEKLIPEKMDAILRINWEALEIFWADIYEEDYAPNIASDLVKSWF